MGVSALELQEWMPEAEFQAHRVQMRIDPDANEKTLHAVRLGVSAQMALANAWGGKFKLTADTLDPWETAKRNRKSGGRDAENRIQFLAVAVFGFPPEVMG